MPRTAAIETIRRETIKPNAVTILRTLTRTTPNFDSSSLKSSLRLRRRARFRKSSGNEKTIVVASPIRSNRNEAPSIPPPTAAKRADSSALASSTLIPSSPAIRPGLTVLSGTDSIIRKMSSSNCERSSVSASVSTVKLWPSSFSTSIMDSFKTIWHGTARTGTRFIPWYHCSFQSVQIESAYFLPV